MANAVRRGRWIAVAALAASYAFLAHRTMATTDTGLGAPLALAPLAAVALSLAWHSTRRAAMMIAVLAACGVLALQWKAIEHHFGAIYWIEHAGTELLLAIAFARTLAEGREPMCSHFARLVHGPLTPALGRYTRRITFAWAAFFAAMSAASTLIFLAAPLRTWSMFANFLTAPLIALMFAAEYIVRRRALPDLEHVHILTAVRLFWEKPSRR